MKLIFKKREALFLVSFVFIALLLAWSYSIYMNNKSSAAQVVSSTNLNYTLRTINTNSLNNDFINNYSGKVSSDVQLKCIENLPESQICNGDACADTNSSPMVIYLDNKWCNSVNPPIHDTENKRDIINIINEIQKLPIKFSPTFKKPLSDEDKDTTISTICGLVHEFRHISDVINNSNISGPDTEINAYNESINCQTRIRNYYCASKNPIWTKTSCKKIDEKINTSKIIKEINAKIKWLIKNKSTNNCSVLKDLIKYARSLGFKDTADITLEEGILNVLNTYLGENEMDECVPQTSPTPSPKLSPTPPPTSTPGPSPTNTPKPSPSSTVSPTITPKISPSPFYVASPTNR